MCAGTEFYCFIQEGNRAPVSKATHALRCKAARQGQGCCRSPRACLAPCTPLVINIIGILQCVRPVLHTEAIAFSGDSHRSYRYKHHRPLNSPAPPRRPDPRHVRYLEDRTLSLFARALAMAPCAVCRDTCIFKKSLKALLSALLIHNLVCDRALYSHSLTALRVNSHGTAVRSVIECSIDIAGYIDSA